MELVNSGYKLGAPQQNLILETQGRIYVKVGERYYELNFKDNSQNQAGSRTTSTTTVVENPFDASEYLKKKELERALANYITKREWSDVKETQNALIQSGLEGFNDVINPIALNTMQIVVGNEALQFDFIKTLEDDSVTQPMVRMDDLGRVVCDYAYIKHYTFNGPNAVQPSDENENTLKYYCRWKIDNPANEYSETILDLPFDNVPYYLYLKCEKILATNQDVDEAVEEEKINIKTGSGEYIISATPFAVEDLSDPEYVYFLCAIINSKSGEDRSIAFLNGFTEILPGQVTAYVFKTSDGKQFLDFLGKKFKIGDESQFLDWNVTNPNTLTIKGNISVVGGDLRNELNNLQTQIDDEIQCWFSTDSGNASAIPLPNHDDTSVNWPVTKDDWVPKDHIGDLYYVVEDDPGSSVNEQGQAFRYIKDGNRYYWTRVLDNSISLALYNAYLAQQAADEALNKFKDWADDGNISAVEIDSIFDEIRFINSDYQDMQYRSEKRKVDSETYTAYKNAYNDYYNVLESISTQWADRGTDDFITLTPECIQSWENTVIAYYNTRTDLLKELTDLDDDLDYLKKALKEGKTDISGGLVLTNLIALGFSLESDPESEQYYNAFRVMSGINGQMLRNESGEYDYKDPAIWFGGSMLDREKESDQENPEVISLFVKHNEEYTKYVIGDAQIEKTLYKWIGDKDKESYYTLTESGGAFVNYLTAEQPLKLLDVQPIGTRYSFSRSIELSLLDNSFIDLSGNNRILGGSMQTYQIVDRTSGTRTAYNIRSNKTVNLFGVFYECLVSSHSLPAGDNVVDLVGTNITIHSTNGTNISGIIFRIDGVDYYFGDIITSTINAETGIIYIIVSQTWGTSINVYTRKGSETFTLYGWKHDNQYIYTLTDYYEKPNCLYLLSDSGNVQYTEDYTIVDYANNLAKAMFRMDGSGYLADGNVSWNTKGDLTLGQGAISIQTDGTVDLGYLHSDKSSFWIGINEDNKMFNISGNTCTINGSLKSKAKSYYEGSFVSVEDSSGTVIADIGSAPLSTAAVPTYLRQTESVNAFYAKGAIMWGVVNIPNNWEYQLIDWYKCFVNGEKYKLNDLNINYEFCRVSKNITLTIVLRDTDVISNITNDIPLYTKTFGVSKTNQEGSVHEGLLDPSIISGISMESMHGYSLIMKLSPGQVQSSISSDSWIRIQRGTCEAEITRTSAPIPKGTFIRPNGISSVFGKNSKFQWLGSMKQSYGVYTDYRDRGGTFIVSVPAVSGGDSASSLIGLEITGYMDSSGNGDTSTPGIRINLGDGWHKLKIEDKILKIIN